MNIMSIVIGAFASLGALILLLSIIKLVINRFKNHTPKVKRMKKVRTHKFSFRKFFSRKRKTVHTEYPVTRVLLTEPAKAEIIVNFTCLMYHTMENLTWILIKNQDHMDYLERTYIITDYNTTR